MGLGKCISLKDNRYGNRTNVSENPLLQVYYISEPGGNPIFNM